MLLHSFHTLTRTDASALLPRTFLHKTIPTHFSSYLSLPQTSLHISKFITSRSPPFIVFSYGSVQSNSMASTSTPDKNELTNPFEEFAPFTSSKRIKQLPYDVFINHRGPDVKHTLAMDLYHALSGMGLRPFLDSKELETGDFLPREITEAMRSAELHIAIFSEKYAESPWCLAELSFMLKTDTPIVPVFYYVDPADVRWVNKGKGVFAPAFLQLEEKGRYTAEKLQEWKTALHEASFYCGHTITKKDDEQMVVKNVVYRVLKDMKKVPLEVAKHPMGLNETVEEFETIARQCHGNVQIVGIWGMGGSGKTTLAKELYNRECSSMQKRVAFSLIFEMLLQEEALHKKQKNLLKDLGFEDASFDHVDQGKGFLARRLTSVSVLIVLDDVDHRDQLEALLPVKDSLASGSLIIVTTREREVLISCGISAIYKMRVLNPSHAKQLFCWHAFLQPSPRSGFEQIVEKFLSSCQGLPLSLKVLGGQLYGRSQMDYWEAQLEKISRILPGDITQRLKISYDALDEEDKEMFLDTACFFIGEERSTAIVVWDGSKWNGLHGLERLVNKCLVELVDESDWSNLGWERITLIRMHDHLRDLGREIANRQSPYRLWSARQTIHIQPAEEICIRGIQSRDFDPDRFHPSSQGEIIVNTNKGSRSLNPFISGLKIFHGSGDFLNQNVSKGSRELVCLRCYDFKEKNLPSWLYSSESLRILELTDARNLEILWEAATDAPSQLRELVLSECLNLKEFPRSMGRLKHLKILEYSCYSGKNFSMRSLPEEFCSLQSLRYLQLESCANLSSLPRRFGELTNLQHLNLYDCSNLSSLPSRFGDLTNLQHLDMGSCRKLRTLPVSFKQLTLLQYLNLEGCSELTIESENLDILENMTRLQYLDFSKCGNMEDLPRPCIENGASLKQLNLGGTRIREVPANICQLSKLEILILGSDSLTSLPTSIGNLSSLTTLEIISCELLTSLPTTLGNLCSLLRLEVMDCDKLECLPDSLGSMCSLRELTVAGCNKLECLPDSLGCLNKLEDLKIVSSGVKTLPESFTRLVNLQSLKIESPISELSFGTGCKLKKIYLRYTKLSKISISEYCCPCLRTLEVCHNYGLMEVETLPTALEVLEFVDCTMKMLKDIRSICGLVNLQTLKISKCADFNLILYVAELTSLKTFELGFYHKVEKIEGSEDLTSLEKLRICDCRELGTLPNFAELISLREIEVEGCLKVQKIEGLQYLRSLEKLKVCGCPELDGLPGFAELSSLKTFELRGCHKVEKIEGSEDLTLLEKLRICDCRELGTLPNFAELSSLREIEMERCLKIQKIEGLEYLRSLEKLKICNCPGFDGLPSFAELISLKTFELKGCPKVEKVEGLEYLTSLKKLSISGCPELDELPSFAELSSLKTFELKGCPKVEKIEGLEDLRSLKEFEAYTCWKVPCIIRLEKARDLRKLVVVANEKSVVEHLIPTIHQKWLDEVIICTRAVCDVGLYVNSHAFPNLSVLDSFSMKKIGSEQELELRGSSKKTILICIIINVVSPVIHLAIRARSKYAQPFEMDLGQGKWVWMGLFTQNSIWRWGNNGIFLEGSDENKVVESAWSMMAEDEEIRQSFRRLFHTSA
ncbi:hypothetical protein KI387_033247, partial [Taxus chinensis]